MYLPREVLFHYSIGKIFSVELLKRGMFHETWKVSADDRAFILQTVNRHFSTTVMEDIEAVVTYLRSKGYQTIEVVRTLDGNLFVNDKGGFWRLFTYIPGLVYREIKTSQIAYAAGFLLGQYHRLFNKFHYQFKHRRPLRHNIPMLFSTYRKVIEANRDPEIAKLLPFIDHLNALNLPPYLRKTVNHGDPKISNFIFDEQTRRCAIAMIDFDDCGKNYNVLYELGSAFCFWSWRGRNTNPSFNLFHFKAAFRGYAEGSAGFLTDEEWSLLPRAIELRPLQLAARFMQDYFEDSYFGWDPKHYASRTAHNLARAKANVAFYKDIIMKRDAINDIVKKIKSLNS